MRARSIRLAGLAALAATAGIVLAGCGGSSDNASSGSGGSSSSPVADLAGPATFGTPEPGGTYRLAQTDFGFTSAFDPSGEYLGTAWNIYSNLMLRTLVSYPFTAGSAGNELVPDLATEVPEPTAGGTVYTFTLKDGITFGPPLNRPITSRDVAYAFERIATPSVAAQYGFYYEAIEGFDAFASGDAETISGIATPDDKTIRFTLTEPVGDFPFRLAMPATAAMPPEVGSCHEGAGEYGRYIVASGPYMFEGSENLDATSCATQRPISGFNPTSRMSLVRNPSYDPASDDASIRQALPDAFLFTINTNEKDIFEKVSAGELESSFDAPPPDILRDYVRGDDTTRERLRVNQGDRLWYIYMNLTTPPFDDIHVRRALNMAVDLDGLRRAWGGPVAGEIATDVIPDAMLGDELTSDNYQPFQGPPFAGDLEKAKQEMALSKYDTDKDGICDAPACKGVVNITQNFGPWAAMAPILDQSAASIGITLDTRQLAPSASFAATGNVSREVPAGSNGGWSKDYADPSTFMTLHDGRTIIPTGNTNSSLVGLTTAQAGELGVDLPAGGVPSVDAEIDACTALTGAERQTCWADLSKRVTEEVVPWIPYLDASNLDLLGPAVTGYDYDQFSGEQSLARAAVDPSLQK